MAKCAHCKKQGLFLNLNSMKLCDKCQKEYELVIVPHIERWQKNIETIKQNGNLAENFSYAVDALESLSAVKEFGSTEIDIINAIDNTQRIKEAYDWLDDITDLIQGMIDQVEKSIFHNLRKLETATEDDLVQAFIASVRRAGATPSDIPYDISKSIHSILNDLVEEEHVVKNKIGDEYRYSISCD